MPLREYQSALVGQVYDALRSASVVLQLPTGGGKTHIGADIAKSERRKGKRIWFVCHRKEIVQQTSAALEALGVPHGLVAANHPVWDGWQVQVCSIAKLKKAFKHLTQPDLVIWDECHHIPARSWSAVKEEFKKANHLGLTATPIRLDGVGLSGHFDQLICGPTTKELVEAGFLSSYRVFAPTIPDLRGIRVRMGDYEQQRLSERMGGAALVGDVVDHYQRITPGLRAIVFAVSVAASRDVAERFSGAGVAAVHIDASTPAPERQAALDDLASGKIKVLSNVELFTEGFDLPTIDVVILLRPTKSFALYRQMIGRGLRVAEGKREAIILDHAGLVHEHGLPDEEVAWTLEGVEVARDRKGTGGFLRRCPECSAVHKHALTCEACGYVYEAQDRTIDEVYGHLEEVVRVAGHESFAQFAARLGRTGAEVRKAFKRSGGPIGLHGLVPVDEALGWLRATGFLSNKDQAPVGSALGQFERVEEFANRVGYSLSGFSNLSGKGMPGVVRGWVEVEPALAWLADWKKKNEKKPTNRPEPKPAPAGEAWAAFKANSRTLCGRATLMAAGLPVFEDGSIRPEAYDWLCTAKLHKKSAHPDYETFAQFARRIGWWERGNSKRRLINLGLPRNDLGLVHILDGVRWAENLGIVRHPDLQKSRFFPPDAPHAGSRGPGEG